MAKKCISCGKDIGVLSLRFKRKNSAELIGLSDEDLTCAACKAKEKIEALSDYASKKSEEWSRLAEEEDRKYRCAVCDSKMRLLQEKHKLKDEKLVCHGCWNLSGFSSESAVVTEDVIAAANARREVISAFVVTTDVAPMAKFNDNSREMLLAYNTVVTLNADPLVQCPQYYTLFSYDQVIGFELLEDGSSIASGGLGRAVVGGALFGGAGAIVGATTRKTTDTCNELTIKVTVNNYKDPAFYIPLIDYKTEKASFTYKEKMKTAQNILSKFELIVSEANSAKESLEESSNRKFEEIRQYKVLMDEGIISEAEFEAKKRELLGL